MTEHVIGIDAWEALDSRALPTVGCTVHVSGGGTGTALAPAGASTGQFEATVLRDGESRFGGNGTSQAVEMIVGKYREILIGSPVHEVDALLSGPTNVTLPISLATVRATADARRLPLWRHLAEIHHEHPVLPCPMVNIFSGGRHAEGGGIIQDFLAVPLSASTFAEAVEIVWRVRARAAELVANRYGRLSAALVADEGGLAVPDGSDSTAIEMLSQAIVDCGVDAGIAIDVAATQVAEPARLVDMLADWIDQFPIVSIEDPMGDDDVDGWKLAASRLGHIQLVGDDYYATNPDRIRNSIGTDTANAVLIKCDQIGTISKAREAMDVARDAGMRTVISARSGDTEDASLADLGVGWNAGQIKIGSLTRSERLAKYNRLLQLESIEHLSYAGWPHS
ncbi:phosphopyruvate hydratase [Prescottella subtropica]|uniref:phosphopyruvate hydratase n=1 Tax=Prescottella subtropica TaxID=2545757 RepID=UPI0010FA5139|nr:enolase C-terminal domain-like protein [Prescottella subtropica]